MIKTRGFLGMAIAAVIFAAFPVQAKGEIPRQAVDVTSLEGLAVQAGGRTKPLDSYAREVLLFVCGRERYQKQRPAETLLSWFAEPNAWEEKSFLRVRLPSLRAWLELADDETHVSPKRLREDSKFLQTAQDIHARKDKKEPVSRLEEEIAALSERVSLFYAVSEGQAITVLPHPHAPSEYWLSFAEILRGEDLAGLPAMKNTEELARIRQSLSQTIDAYRSRNQDAFRSSSAQFKERVSSWGGRLGVYPSQEKLSRELHYFHLKPFQKAWIFYLVCFLAVLLNAGGKKWLTGVSLAAYLGGFLIAAYGLILRIVIAGRPPVSNMYESIVWVSWAVSLFALILWIVYRKNVFLASGALLSAVGLLIADSVPTLISPHISPLEPVLRSNFWLTIHVLTITLSYGAFALALGLGHVYLVKARFTHAGPEALNELSKFLYRAMQVGVVLLAAGTILGGVWANYSWGRFWGWDPKETWALIALLGYLVILHGRYAGWISPFGMAVGSVLAFLGVLMTWYGVNFILAAGLHSYGFGGGGIPYVIGYVLAELVFLSACAVGSKRPVKAAGRRQ